MKAQFFLFFFLGFSSIVLSQNSTKSIDSVFLKIGKNPSTPTNVFYRNESALNFANEYKLIQERLNLKKSILARKDSLQNLFKEYRLSDHDIVNYNFALEGEVYELNESLVNKYIKKSKTKVKFYYNDNEIDYTNNPILVKGRDPYNNRVKYTIFFREKHFGKIAPSRNYWNIREELIKKLLSVIKKNKPEESINKKILVEKLFGIDENYFNLENEIKALEAKNEDVTKNFFRLTENGGLFCGSIWKFTTEAYSFGVLFNSVGDTIFVGPWEDNFPNLKNGKLFQYSSSKNETYLKNDYNIFISYSPKGEVYCGNHKNNIRSGEGVYVWTSNDLYKGTWQEGNRTGKGTFLWSNGDKYEGDFISGDRTGFGKYTFSSGGVWEGNWQNSKFTGLGKQISKNGDITEGQFENGNLTKTKETLNQESFNNNLVIDETKANSTGSNNNSFGKITTKSVREQLNNDVAGKSDFDFSKVKFRTINNNNGQKCKWCSKSVCVRRSNEAIENEKDLSNDFNKVTVAAKVRYLHEFLKAIEPNRDPYLLDIDLYNCPEFCSLKCENDYRKAGY
jgi:hypothetical protein